MARRIIIHAGQHKTGSTSIQRYIERNHDFFRNADIAECPDWSADLTEIKRSGLFCNAKFIANAMIRDDLATPMRIKGLCRALSEAEKRQGLARINACLRNLPQETVLVSAEAFSFMREPEERNALDMLCNGMAARAIMFLREPHDWRDSWQTVLNGLPEQAQTDSAPDAGIFDLSEGSWLTDHAAIRAFWGGQCTFLNYETAMQRDGSVIPALLEELGLDPAECPAWNDYHLNRSAARAAGNAQR